MRKEEWTVLLIGGSSGIGKTRLTNELARIYNAKVIEADDICLGVKAMTTEKSYPAIHYWYGDADWEELTIHENVKCLKNVGEELTNGLKAIIDNSIKVQSKLIIEGDFISVKLASTYNNSRIKKIYIHESDEKQIVDNYLKREGGELQEFRASISYEYGKILKNDCNKNNICVIESRPWNTLLNRAIEGINK